MGDEGRRNLVDIQPGYEIEAEHKEEKKADEPKQPQKDNKTKFELKEPRRLILIAILATIYIAFLAWHTSLLKSLPSPLFGGDYYHSLGHIYHMISGGNPLQSSVFIGSLPSYFPLYTIIISITSIITTLSPFQAMLATSFAFCILSIVIFFLLSEKISGSVMAALVATVIFLQLNSYPIYKYLQFAQLIMIPLTILCAYWHFKSGSWRSAITWGCVLGLMGLTHSVGFVYSVLFFVFLSAYLILFRHIKIKPWSFDKHKFKTDLKGTIIKLIVIGAIFTIIAQLYWFKPLFVYHANPPNPVVNISQTDMAARGNQIQGVWETLKIFIGDYSSIGNILVSILVLLSLLYVFTAKKDINATFLRIYIAFAILTGVHFIVTMPLLGTHLSVDYMRGFSSIIKPLLVAYLLGKLIKDYIKIGIIVCAIIAILLLTCNFITALDHIENNQKERQGRLAIHPGLLEMQDWVLKNTNVYDVFLTNNELGFMLNSLTGRKLISFKRGHTDMFTEAESRATDHAIMLYGKNDSVRKNLLNKYDAKYLYWNALWLEKEFEMNGEQMSPVDPITILNKKEHAQRLDQANVTYIEHENYWLDSSKRMQQHVRKYPAIIVLPSRFYPESPWDESLDKYLELAWESDTDIPQKIYRIKTQTTSSSS